MRFTWTVAGDDPDWTTLQEHGITGLFAPLFDSLTSRAYLKDFQARGYVAGLYLAHNQFPTLDPKALAQKVVTEYNRLTGPVGNQPALKGVRLMLNIEQHDPDFVIRALREVRRLLPTVGLSWSPEGMQGGWMSPEFVAEVVSLRVRVVPQAYTGPMLRVESDQTLRDLLDAGFPSSSISIFYDAAQLGEYWDGYAFTAGRLP